MMTVEELQSLVVKAMESHSQQVDARFNRLEKLFDENEKITALLTQSYTEIAALVETISSVLINRSEEDKKEFFDTLALSRKKMMETLHHGIQVAEHNADRFTAYSPDSTPESESPPHTNDG